MTLALVMAGATNEPDGYQAQVNSCIGFMNTVAKSKTMAEQLQSDTVRKWLERWMQENRTGQPPAHYRLEHLDASSNSLKREDAKRRLAQASESQPHGILNVGIFGEGTDAPSLSAVAFLEPRKSPVDVIQAVGRAMRTAPNKELGYIVCPIVIPPAHDAETWLATSSPDEGWQELGQILLALRAHDSRIEDSLAELLKVYVPPAPEEETTAIGIADDAKQRIQYYAHVGNAKDVPQIIEDILDGKQQPSKSLQPLSVIEQTARPRVPSVPKPADPNQPTLIPSSALVAAATTAEPATEPMAGDSGTKAPPEPSSVITGKRYADGSKELRRDSPARVRNHRGDGLAPVDYQATKKKATEMINQGAGTRVPGPEQRKRNASRRSAGDKHAQLMLDAIGLIGDNRNAITANLLTKSGLTGNRVQRDLNLLEYGVGEAARCLGADNLKGALDAYFLLDNLNEGSRKAQANGCTIAALLMMNAAMLHQRIVAGQWLSGISDLSQLKNDENVVRNLSRAWERIMRHDFHPVLEPALEAVYAVESTGKVAGLTQALHVVCAEAERIAHAYADMGADHAGPLFNKVMGNQASDGAYFTRPVAASIAARLTLDACGDVDWRDPEAWREHKTVDLACGSGTLLAAMLTDMKRRAREAGATDGEIADLQRLAVEDCIKGMDINPVSLQLAASQLTAGNTDVRYKRMGLHLMPYGPQANRRVKAGTLELLGQKAIVPRPNELALTDETLDSQGINISDEPVTIEDAATAAQNIKIVITNPPFTSRSKMGEKFPEVTKNALRKRVDSLEQILTSADQRAQAFSNKRSVGPLFVALAEQCTKNQGDLMTMVHPTITLTTTTGRQERMLLAERFHIHTVLTCHEPKQANLVQGSNINESIIFAARRQDGKNHTRFINLDQMPVNEAEANDLHRCLTKCQQGDIGNGWGEVSLWPYERMATGDWTPAIWRSSELAEAAASLAESKELIAVGDLDNISISMTEGIVNAPFKETDADSAMPVIRMSGANGQTFIRMTPDAYYSHEARTDELAMPDETATVAERGMMEKAGHLLVTAGQDSGAARLTAVAGDTKCLGTSWIPVTGLSPEEAKALAVSINSTPGRIQLMRSMGRKLAFPMYRPAAYTRVRIPDVKDTRIRGILADCWERTKDTVVPQYRDGECEVRRLWHEAVADAMGWDSGEMERLRLLLHQEPHVRGLGYGQYTD